MYTTLDDVSHHMYFSPSFFSGEHPQGTVPRKGQRVYAHSRFRLQAGRLRRQGQGVIEGAVPGKVSQRNAYDNYDPFIVSFS